MVVKSQIIAQHVADFLAEFARNDQTNPDWWSLYIDGASSVKGNGGRNHPRRPRQCHPKASSQTQLQSLKQSGLV